MNSEEKSRRANLIANFGKAYEQLAEAIKEFPQEMWKFKPAPNRWSIHEVIIHIADSEVNSFSRCRKILAENGGTIVAYDQDSLAATTLYHEQNTTDALELFRLLRKMTYELLLLIPDELWSNYALHSSGETWTLTKWLEIYEGHIPGHIAQMRKVHVDWLSVQ